jgi:hypothetical protein
MDTREQVGNASGQRKQAVESRNQRGGRSFWLGNPSGAGPNEEHTMRMIPIRPLLISAASASLLLAAPAFAQDAAPPPPPPAQDTVIPGNMAPPPADAMNKTYPVCRGGMTDNCQNPGEGGAPGRSRASDVKGGSPAAGTHHRMHHRHRG